ncbi:MAG: P22 coat - protein 5 family protein, partial [bacterium]|nr:P22 coat - protein 5 family protein [bacterium]
PDGKNLQRAEVGQTIRFPITQAQSSAAITPGQLPPDTGDQTVDNSTLTISKAQQVPIRWNGEEEQGLRTGDTPRLGGIQADQFAQAFRTLRNEIEEDIGSTYTACSRAYGTAGTTPFASSIEDANQMYKILVDNGAPKTDNSIVINTSAGLNLRNLSVLNQVNTSGTSATLRDGILLPLTGFDIRESAQVATHTAGGATGFDADGGEPIGETTILVNGSDSGTILAGDALSWVGDSNKYVVQSATASGSATGNIVIQKPGLNVTLAADVEGSLSASYTANMAFNRNAIVLITRLPMLPSVGGVPRDSALERMTVTDPVSGISYEISLYYEYKQLHIEVACVWGFSIVKPEHTAILMG